MAHVSPQLYRYKLDGALAAPLCANSVLYKSVTREWVVIKVRLVACAQEAWIQAGWELVRWEDYDEGSKSGGAAV